MNMERLPLFRARFRVLVLKNPSAKKSHQRVNAVCLELNLVGRGRTTGAALEDLTGVVFASIGHEFNLLVPMPHPDPDPGLLAIFTGEHPETPEGEVVLRRLFLNLGVSLTRKAPFSTQSGARHQSRQAVYEDCLV